jgi:hypothetical protein
MSTTLTVDTENSVAKELSITSGPSPFMLNLIFLPETASRSPHTVEAVLAHLDQAGHSVTACVCGEDDNQHLQTTNIADLDQPAASIQAPLEKLATVVKVDVNASVDAILSQAIAQLHQKYTYHFNPGTDLPDYIHANTTTSNRSSSSRSSYIPKPSDPPPFHRRYHESFAAYRQSSTWYTGLADAHTAPPVFSLYTPRPPALLDAERCSCFHYRPYSRHSSSILHIAPTAHRVDQVYSLISKIPLGISLALFIYNNRDFFVPNLRLLLDLDLTDLIKSIDLMWTSFALEVQNYMFEMYLQTL